MAMIAVAIAAWLVVKSGLPMNESVAPYFPEGTAQIWGLGSAGIVLYVVTLFTGAWDDAGDSEDA